jgi:hypothetical protein
LADAVDKFGK